MLKIPENLFMMSAAVVGSVDDEDSGEIDGLEQGGLVEVSVEVEDAVDWIFEMFWVELDGLVEVSVEVEDAVDWFFEIFWEFS